MWIFTPYGFFSAVAVDPLKLPQGEAERLGLDSDTAYTMVRARVEEDAHNLIDHYETVFDTEGPEILAWPNRDYPYRVIMTAYEWAILCSAFADEIDYTNFKDRVTVKQGEARHDLYMRVWGTMNNAEHKLERIEEQNAQRLPQSAPQGHLFNWIGQARSFPPDPEELTQALAELDDEDETQSPAELPEGTHEVQDEDETPPKVASKT